MQLSIVLSNNMLDIMGEFESSHQQASEAMMVYAFVPRNFDRKVDKSDKKSKKYTQPNAPVSKAVSSSFNS